MWIDPRKVHHQVGTSRPESRKIREKFARMQSKGRLTTIARRQTLRVSNALESFVIDPDYYEDLIAFEKNEKYNRVSDITKHRGDYKSSKWYSDLICELSEHGVAKHKKIMMRSENDVDHFMKYYVLSMLDSLERDGFDPAKGGGLGKALIGKDGLIHKSGSGHHRFYAARVLGIKPIPVLIAGAHENWYRKNIGSRFALEKLRAALGDVQAKHT